MSAEKYPTFVYALPVLRQMKIHLSKDDMFTTDCPDENVKKFIENYGTETFMPSLLSTLETIRQGMLDEFKKRFTGMTIDILWTTILDPRCWSLRYLNQNEIQAAKNKLIKEVSGVPCKEEACTEEDNGIKRKPIKGFDIFDAPQKTMSSSASTADSSEVKGAKELLWQKSATWEVENYLDFFAIKVAPDAIHMDWWEVHRHQFPRIAQLARKLLCVTATSTHSERVFSV